MNVLQKALFLFISSVVVSQAGATATTNDNDLFTTAGRVEVLENNTIALIGSASSVSFGFTGTKCTVSVQSIDTHQHHNYVVIEVDGKYYSRNRVEASGTSIEVKVLNDGKHLISVYKATEAGIGKVVFLGATGNLFKTKAKSKKKIEFIGDSITCGMGNDIDEVPCGTGEWYDQHNAYYSYAPIAARELGAGYVLSSVSGIGIYRNWNDEHDKEAIMPDVYNNLYLNKDASKPYKSDFKADVTCIALGTNDFSDGDGTKPRLPFNEDAFVTNYVNFINIIYKKAPNTHIILLDSPMVNGTKSEIFVKCLNRVKTAINNQKKHKPVEVFTFSAVVPQGCGYHPEIQEDILMASQLVPFLKTLL